MLTCTNFMGTRNSCGHIKVTSTNHSSKIFRASTSSFYYKFLNQLILVVCLTILSSRDVANAEYFSSVDSLQKLGDIELGLVQTYRNYLEMQEREFDSYRQFIEHVKEQHAIANENLEDYLGNPIHAFTLIKRMVTDWNHLHGYIKDGIARTEFQKQLTELSQEETIPDATELKGAILGIARLQSVYNLNAQDLASGNINGINYGTALSWHDCFEIATNLFDQKEFVLALTWFETSLDKLNKVEDSQKDQLQRKFEIEILEYLALTNYEIGNADTAVDHIDNLLKLKPDHHTKDLRDYMLNSPPKKYPVDAKANMEYYKNYTRLCQGQQVPEKRLQRLTCKIETRGKPYLILAPLKIEELSKDPEINLYHGLLTDTQIERILKEASNFMFRSLVKNGTGSAVSDARISQQAWLKYESPTMKAVKILVSTATGLDLQNCEQMQVANYGIGGQYGPHNDFLGNKHSKMWIGDRIATNMFYLSDVEQGGYTAFPKINIFAKPVKGGMVSWYNLHKSLSPDYRTFHAGCPVIKGSKRIGNIWVHSGYQEFVRPCGLLYDK